MKLYLVDWSVPDSPSINVNPNNFQWTSSRKIFLDQKKAHEFKIQLKEAIRFLGMSNESIIISISEIEAVE